MTKSKTGINDCIQLAQKRDGQCLSTDYSNSTSKLTWQCNKGHVWETSYSVIKMGHWCPICANEKNSSRQRFNIEHAKELAKKKGGQCISVHYKNARSNLKWQCHKGHEWAATYDSIRGGSWCPYCGGKKPFDLTMLNAIAKKNGGKCISTSYRPGQKVMWECKEGHEFESIPSSAKKGHWCPHCARSAPLTIEHAKTLAKKNGGSCLSNKYIKSSTKLEWECENGHRWRAPYNSVQSGHWCPICSQGLGERLCRIYFEKTFGVKFPNTRKLPWLVNENGNRLELDGYSGELKIAFEHNGEHHYKDDHYFSGDNHDQLKKELCLKNGVLLIEIPQIGHLIELKDLPKIIERNLRENKREVPTFPEISKIDFKEAIHPKWMEELSVIAQQNGGKCLSNRYLGSSAKLKWQCQNGHVWFSSPEKIKRGDWCDKCARTESGVKRSLGINAAIDLAKERGGNCLSEKYTNSKTKLTWQCHEGHIWHAIMTNVKKGHWCPICANYGSVKKKRWSIKDAQIVAKENQGKCLSVKYVNNKTKLIWECKHGHKWESTLGEVIRGGWCKTCIKST